MDSTDMEPTEYAESNNESEGEQIAKPQTIDRNAYLAMFKTILNENKFVLQSGRVVEDILYEYGKSQEIETAVHSFILNVDDPDIMRLFQGDERTEINALKPMLPAVAPNMLTELAKYSKSNIDEVRQALMEHKVEGMYDRRKHFDMEWIHMAVRTMINLWENPDVPMARPNLEVWNMANVYNQLVDFGFHAPGIYVAVVRGEGSSIASSERRNRRRHLGQRKKLGHKIDGILRGLGNDVEFGVFEAARIFSSEAGTKYLKDSLKLLKAMKDIFLQMTRRVQQKDEWVNKLTVIGSLHQGLQEQTYLLLRAKGIILIATRTSAIQIPTMFSPSVMKEILKLIGRTWQTREVVRGVRELIEKSAIDEDLKDSQTEATDTKWKSPKKKAPEIPDCFTTPTKAPVAKFRMQTSLSPTPTP
ncbi:hypothetical protein BC938DRAFT_473937 [Jimgerdemannia flammicorona]|uniref:Uncharacterized protein n=1 Tax=Jimgerdemannia flammicorona TaxID=994334 RepID=A0A433QZN0_9FUNG|nr:hypothetical protein BC938DRAFT_473937 [Jimgerdemannia flammicorona]